MEEILQLAYKEMEKSKLVDYLSAGVVLTGGVALLDGLVELGERVLGMPVKIGNPIVSGGLEESVNSPIYATGVGLIQYAIKHMDDTEDIPQMGFNWVVERLRSFFENLFK